MVYFLKLRNYTFVVVQSQSHVWCFVTPWTMPGFPVLYYLPEFAQELFTKPLIFFRFYHFFLSAFFSVLWQNPPCHIYPSCLLGLFWFVTVSLSSLFFMVWILWRLLVPYFIAQFSSVVQARLPCPSLTPRVYENLCPLSRWCHPTISSSVIPFSSCLQSFPASESFLVSQFFTSGD